MRDVALLELLHEDEPGARAHRGAHGGQDARARLVAPVVEDVLQDVDVGARGQLAEEAALDERDAVAQAAAREMRLRLHEDALGLHEHAAQARSRLEHRRKQRPAPPATSHTVPDAGHSSAAVIAGASIAVRDRIAEANSRSSSGCAANQSQTDMPCTRTKAASPGARSPSGRPRRSASTPASCSGPSRAARGRRRCAGCGRRGSGGSARAGRGGRGRRRRPRAAPGAARRGRRRRAARAPRRSADRRRGASGTPSSASAPATCVRWTPIVRSQAAAAGGSSASAVRRSRRRSASPASTTRGGGRGHAAMLADARRPGRRQRPRRGGSGWMRSALIVVASIS